MKKSTPKNYVAKDFTNPFSIGAGLWGIDRLQDIDGQSWSIYVYEKDGEFFEVALPPSLDLDMREFNAYRRTRRKRILGAQTRSRLR